MYSYIFNLINQKEMKKVIIIVTAILAITATSCKKNKDITPETSAIAQIDGKTMKVESIKIGEIDIAEYAINGFVYNKSKPTLFEPKINSGGTTLLYKTTDNSQMETAQLIETKGGLLNIQFTDSNPNGIGSQNNVYVPQELLDKRIVTYQQNNCAYCQAYYICSSEVMNGNYNVEKVGERFILTRTEEPVIIMTMTIK